MEPETRVVYADYAGPSHVALATLLGGLEHAKLVAGVEDPDVLVEIVQRERPDVVVVDDRMLRGSRWDAGDLGARLIVVGVDDDPGYLARARQLGAEAWIPKERAASLLPVMLSRAPVSP